jgi:hypothetical protein
MKKSSEDTRRFALECALRMPPVGTTDALLERAKSIETYIANGNLPVLPALKESAA